MTDETTAAVDAVEPVAGAEGADAIAPEAPAEPAAATETKAIIDMTDDELRAFIKARDGRAPHSAMLRENLLAKALGGTETAPAEPEEPKATEELDAPEAAEAEPEAEAPTAAEEDATPAEAVVEPAAQAAPVELTAHEEAALHDAIELRVSELVGLIKAQAQAYGLPTGVLAEFVAHHVRAAL